MMRSTSLPPTLRVAMTSRRLLKVIAGLTNLDPVAVLKIARAAAAGGADLVDIACEPALVRAVAAACPQLPICVSAVDPELFPAAVAAGAAMVEIGNFDSFYPQGRIFGADEVLELTRRTRALLPEVVLSVTVPHVLPLDQQELLAVDLVAAGADLIQTEGGTSARPFSAGSLGLIEKAAPTLAAAHAERAAFGFLIQNHDDQGDHHHQMDRQNNLRHFSPSLTRSGPSAGARRSIPPRFYTMTAGAQSLAGF